MNGAGTFIVPALPMLRVSKIRLALRVSLVYTSNAGLIDTEQTRGLFDITERILIFSFK